MILAKKARTLEQSNRERAAVYIAAFLLAVFSGLLLLYIPKAFAQSNVMLVSDMTTAYGNLKEAVSHGMIDRVVYYRGLMDSLNQSGFLVKDSWANIIRGLASLVLFAHLGGSILHEAGKGDYSSATMIRSTAITLIAVVLVLSSGWKAIFNGLDTVGEFITAQVANSENKEGTGGTQSTALATIYGQTPQNGAVVDAIKGLVVDLPSQKKGEDYNTIVINAAKKKKNSKADDLYFANRKDAWSAVVDMLENDLQKKQESTDASGGSRKSKAAQNEASLYEIPQDIVADFCSGAATITMLLNLPVLVVSFLTFVQIVEMQLRYIFAPIAVANITMEGMRSPGVSYFKRYLGCYIKIALYTMISVICSSMSLKLMNPKSTITANISLPQITLLGLNINPSMIVYLGVHLIGLYIMMQAASIVNDVLE